MARGVFGQSVLDGSIACSALRSLVAVPVQVDSTVINAVMVSARLLSGAAFDLTGVRMARISGAESLTAGSAAFSQAARFEKPGLLWLPSATQTAVSKAERVLGRTVLKSHQIESDF